MSRIAILGGGSWGTGLAVSLSYSRRKHDIRLWVRDPELAHSIESNRENKKYLAEIPIPGCVRASTDIAEVLQRSNEADTPYDVSLFPSVDDAAARVGIVRLNSCRYLREGDVILSKFCWIDNELELRRFASEVCYIGDACDLF